MKNTYIGNCYKLFMTNRELRNLAANKHHYIDHLFQLPLQKFSAKLTIKKNKLNQLS